VTSRDRYAAFKTPSYLKFVIFKKKINPPYSIPPSSVEPEGILSGCGRTVTKIRSSFGHVDLFKRIFQIIQKIIDASNGPVLQAIVTVYFNFNFNFNLILYYHGVHNLSISCRCNCTPQIFLTLTLIHDKYSPKMIYKRNSGIIIITIIKKKINKIPKKKKK
jgi:hypothetical protein